MRDEEEEELQLAMALSLSQEEAAKDVCSILLTDSVLTSFVHFQYICTSREAP